MDMGKLKEWFKDISSGGKVIIAVTIIAAVTVLVAFFPNNLLKIWEKFDSSRSTAQIGNQFNEPVNVKDSENVEIGRIGDTHNHGLSVEDAMKLAEKLASEKGEKDAQVIKSLQETIQALTLQNAKKYDITQALDLLAQGDTTQAEAIFAGVAEEAKRAGKEENLKEAEALRHLGSLAYLHDTQKALKAYKRSTELDPGNLDGWNNLGRLYQRIGEIQNAENSFKTILNLSNSPRECQDAAYGNLGVVHQMRGDLDLAVEFYQKSILMNKELGNIHGLANNYGNLGNVHQIRGELDRAVEYYEKSLAIEMELGNRQGIADNYANLGIVHHIRGNLDQAVELHQKSLAINTELGRMEGLASSYTNLGAVYQTRGDLDQTVEYFEKALSISNEQGLKLGLAASYNNLGIVYQIRGDLDRAVEYLEKALVIDMELGNREGIAKHYNNLGTAHRIRGELDRAVEYHEKALAINKELGRKQGMADAYSDLGIVNMSRGELGLAVELYEKALAIDQELGRKEGMAARYANLGIVYETKGDLKRAIDYWKQSLEFYKHLGTKNGIAEIQSWIDEAVKKSFYLSHSLCTS